MLASLFTLAVLLPALLIRQVIAGRPIWLIHLAVAFLPAGLLIIIGFFKLVGVL